MRSCTQNFLNKIAASSRSIKAKVKFGNTTYYDYDKVVSIDIEAAPYDGKRFGFSIAQKAVVKLLSNNTSFTVGDEFIPSIGVPSANDPDVIDYVQYQPFYIDTIETDKKNGQITITGYDAMSKLNNFTYGDLSFAVQPVRYYDILSKIANKIGISFTEYSSNLFWSLTVAVNDINMSSDTKLRELLDDLCEFTGTYAYITYDASTDKVKLRAKALDTSTANPVLTLTKYHIYEVDQNDVFTLSGVSHVNSLNDVVTVGTSDNYVQVLNDNSLLSLNKSTSFIQSVLNTAKNSVPANITTYAIDWIGNPALEYGDLVKIELDNSNYFFMYYMGEKLSYNGGLKASSEWNKVDSTAIVAEATTNVSSSIKRAEAKIDKVNAEIELKVSSDEVISSINLSPEQITINSNKINLTGYVTMTDLSTAGSTTINGSNITTGSINANRITTGTMSANRISGGAITGSSIELKDSEETTVFAVSDTGELSTVGGSINTQSLKVSDGVNDTEITPTTLYSKNITGVSVTSGEIKVGNGNVKLTPSATSTVTRYFNALVVPSGTYSNSWKCTITSYSDSAKTTVATVPTLTTVSVKLRFGNPNTQFYTETKSFSLTISAGSSATSQYQFTTTTAYNPSSFVYLPSKSEMPIPQNYSSGTTGLCVNNRIIPTMTGVYDLGASNLKWADVYSTGGIVQTSDRNQKTDIRPIDDKYIDLFDNLQPVTYKLSGGHRTHIGLVAQDVEEAMTNAGIDSEEFACLVIGQDEQGNNVYNLRYGELIGLLVKEVQDLKAKVKSLEEGDN